MQPSSCVEVRWHKSAHSNYSGCVEVAKGENHWHLRDSKDQSGPVLTFSQAEMEAFAAGIRANEFGF